MSYDISNLDAKLKEYLSANKDELITNEIFNSKTSQMFTIQQGVKNPTAIVRLDSTIVFDDGTQCGFDAQGSDTFTNRILTPNFIKVNKSYCPKDLLNTWKATDVRIAASKQEDGMPFEGIILDQNTKLISAEIEKLLWAGDTTGSGNMAQMDGFHKMVEDDLAAGVIPATNQIAKGSDTVFVRCQKLWNALPANIADKVTLVTSITNYKQLILDLMNSNMYHIFEQYEGEYRMRLPFANIDLIGVEGLEGMDVIYALPLDEVYYGVDLENDSEDIDFYFDKSERNFKFVSEFVVALQYAFPEHIFVNE